jgi:hypothetical protein
MSQTTGFSHAILDFYRETTVPGLLFGFHSVWWNRPGFTHQDSGSDGLISEPWAAKFACFEQRPQSGEEARQTSAALHTLRTRTSPDRDPKSVLSDVPR